MIREMRIDDFVIHSLTDTNPKIWLQDPIEGFDSPDYRLTEYDSAGEDGGFVPSAFYGRRSITLPGFFKGADSAEYEANRRSVIQAVSIQRDTFGMPVPRRITITMLSGETYFVDAHFKKPEARWDRIGHGNFLLQATVPDSFIYSTQQITSSALTKGSGGGYLSPRQSPYLTAASTGGTMAITNGGGVAVLPLILLTGTLTNPVITNTSTGKFIRLSYTLDAGNTAIIDMKKKTITLNGSSSLLGTRSTDSEWWGLNIGINNIKLETGSTSDTGNVMFSYYEAETGI